MARGIIIDSNKKKAIEAKHHKFIKPKKVYLPVSKGTKILVKKGDYVFKGSVVAKLSADEFPVISTASGTYLGTVNKKDYKGVLSSFMIIENDFKERHEKRVGMKRFLLKYSKEDVIRLLKDNALVGMSGSNFPTYLKYQPKYAVNKLLINAMESEPFISSDASVIKYHVEQLLEIIDVLMTLFNLDQADIAINAEYEGVIRELNLYLGTYPNINLIVLDNRYPLGYEKMLIKKVYNAKYDKYPHEVGVIINNVTTMFNIYRILKFQRPISERFITIGGNLIETPLNVTVKIGTLASEVLEELGVKPTTDENVKLVSGGPMRGAAMEDADFVISHSTTGILFLSDKNNGEAMECNNCSKCVNVCPVKIAPCMIKRASKAKNKKKLKKLKPNKCMECGLCTYICPAKIDLRSVVIKAKGGKV